MGYNDGVTDGSSSSATAYPGCVISAVAFYFPNKVEQAISVEEASDAMARGGYVWVDVTVTDTAEAAPTLRELGLVDAGVIEAAMTGEEATLHARHDEFLHLVLTGCRLAGRDVELERVDAVLRRGGMVTLHRGRVAFIDAMHRECSADFHRHAQTPSFLIYELWDHLIENYQHVQNQVEDMVEAVQRDLMTAVSERVFTHIAELGTDILHFRKILLPARSVLTELATRKSVFVSEATQPYLINMVGSLERVLQDLLVDHEVLNNALNLHMSMASHRMNQIMQRLTVISVIFLPLTFLCGVYGMNFKYLPEFDWRYGYFLFWLVVALVVIAQLVYLWRKRWL
ncbi:MAG: hypothetical protein GC159_07165 [Phycisphaera sp.]|nr:hypothetical protein [Phycisphaera sp.]